MRGGEAGSHRVRPERHGGEYTKSGSGAMSDGQDEESNARDANHSAAPLPAIDQCLRMDRIPPSATRVTATCE